MSGTFIGDQTAVIDTSTSSGLPPDTKEKATPVRVARSQCCLLGLGGCETRSQGPRKLRNAAAHLLEP